MAESVKKEIKARGFIFMSAKYYDKWMEYLMLGDKNSLLNHFLCSNLWRKIFLGFVG